MKKLYIYVVGGAVRDIILGLTPTDIDYVVVGSTPTEMESFGYKQVGADFPVFLCPNGDEYALARTERKIDNGYHGFETNHDPSITIEEDLYRRDITINSMAVRLDDWEEFKHTKNVNLVIDPHRGIDDINNKILKHTSHHFCEDPVRVLRIARFQAKYNFDISKSTSALLVQMVNSGEIDHLVPERVWTEINKAIKLQNAIHFFWVLQRCGALDILIPGLSRTLITYGFCIRFATLREHSIGVRMMLTFGFLDDPKKTLLQLQAPSTIIKRVVLFKKAETLIHSNMEPKNILKFLNQIGENKSLLYVISTALCTISYDQGLRFNAIIKGANAIANIGFHSLSANQQESLKGLNIGIAIDELKMEAINMSDNTIRTI